MTLTRRRMIQGTLAGVAAGGLGGLPRWSHAAIEVGTFQIETLSDGHMTLPPEFIFGPMPKSELREVLAANGMTTDAPLTPECNVTLIRQGDNVILFDAGAGASFQSSTGQISDAMDSIGLSPDDVTHVVFTHAHPDHLWGVLDDFDDPFFSQAEHLIGKAEWEYWINPATVDTIDTGRTAFAVGAKRRLEVIEDSMTFFGDGEEVLPGIAARMTPGHTPGHMAFEVRSGNESVMIIGDAIGNHHVAFARPEWLSGSDQDQETAAETRVALFDQIAHEQMRIIGFHLPEGGIGRAEKAGEAYRFMPDES